MGDIDGDAVKYVKYISANVRRRGKLTMSEKVRNVLLIYLANSGRVP